MAARACFDVREGPVVWTKFRQTKADVRPEEVDEAEKILKKETDEVKDRKFEFLPWRKEVVEVEKILKKEAYNVTDRAFEFLSTHPTHRRRESHLASLVPGAIQTRSVHVYTVVGNPRGGVPWGWGQILLKGYFRFNDFNKSNEAVKTFLFKTEEKLNTVDNR